jgi:hypothetical protein
VFSPLIGDRRTQVGSNSISGISGWEVAVDTTVNANTYFVQRRSWAQVSPTVQVTLRNCQQRGAAGFYSDTPALAIMSDEQHKPPGGGVRRVGRKDRKSRIDPTEPLFPQDEPPEQAENLPSEPLPFDDVDAALRALSELDQLAESVEATVEEPRQPPEPAVMEERFPPLNPAVIEPPSPPPPLPPPSRRRGIARQDVIAAFFFVATLALLGWIAVVWMNPFSSINPFAPPTPFVVITSTHEPQPTSTPQPTSAPTGIPTVGPTASFTPLVEVAVTGATDSDSLATPTLASGTTPAPLVYPFVLAETGVVYIPNSNGRGCDWSSIAGTVTGLEGEALNGYGVHIVGETLDEKVFSGTAQTFGPGGFELFLNGVPQQARYTVRLLTAAGTPLSDYVLVVTSERCDQNVALVNFVQQAES